MHTRLSGILLLILAVLLSPACAAKPASSPPQDVIIVIPAGTYEAEQRGLPSTAVPQKMTLLAGQSVTVKNDDYAMHYLFDLPISPGQTARKTFQLPGKFVYTGGLSCSVNRDSGLTVEVLGSGGHSNG